MAIKRIVEKKEETKERMSVSEITVIVIVALITVVIGAMALGSYFLERNSDENDAIKRIEAAFSSTRNYADNINHLGDNIDLLPEDEDSHYVWIEGSGEVKVVSYSEIYDFGGYVYEESRCCITVECKYGTGYIVGYSKNLEDDIKSINTFYITGRHDFLSDGIEKDFAEYIMAKRYYDTAIIDGGEFFGFDDGDMVVLDDYSRINVLVVSDKLTEEVLLNMKNFYSVTQIIIADKGSYSYNDEGIYDGNYTKLELAFPWITSLTVPNSVIGIADGALEWCRHIETLSIPYTSVRAAFNNDIPNSLNEINFTSASITVGSFLTGCSSVTRITFCDDIKTFTEGAFEGLNNLEYVKFGKNTKYFFLDVENIVSNALVYAPESAIAYGTVQYCGYTQETVNGVTYNVYEINAEADE